MRWCVLPGYGFSVPVYQNLDNCLMSLQCYDCTNNQCITISFGFWIFVGSFFVWLRRLHRVTNARHSLSSRQYYFVHYIGKLKVRRMKDSSKTITRSILTLKRKSSSHSFQCRKPVESSKRFLLHKLARYSS